MRKILAIFVLFSLSIQLSGYHLYYRYSRWSLKTTMIARLRNGNTGVRLREFHVTPASDAEKSRWLREREFSYHGDMYDVVDRKEDGARIILHCVKDNEETELVAHYEKMAKNDFGKKPAGKSVHLLKLASSLYVYTAQTADIVIYPDASLHHARHGFRLTDHVPGILTPPPRRA